MFNFTPFGSSRDSEDPAELRQEAEQKAEWAAQWSDDE
jgi:hypothetical protein